jgi:dimethylaniline monooxygenase (N-oxide forming)
MLATTTESPSQPYPSEPKAQVAVIGAGASGLAAIKECLAVGLSVTCFEQSDGIGGLWRYEEPMAGKEVHSSVYKNTIINTSKPMVI